MIPSDRRPVDDPADELLPACVSIPAAPREIEVYIDELVLHGFDPKTHRQIGDAIEKKLHGLLAAKGVPSKWLSSPMQIVAGSIRADIRTKPSQAGAEIASTVYGGGVA